MSFFGGEKTPKLRSSGQIDCRRTKKASQSRGRRLFFFCFFWDCGAKRPSHRPRMIGCQLQLIKALSALDRAAQTHCVGGETHGAAVEIKTRLSWLFFLIIFFFFCLTATALRPLTKREITDSAMRPIAELILRFFLKTIVSLCID